MAEKPFLSVIMPVHNGAEWIGATLDSLVADPIAGLEVIIIDSSTNHTTAAVVERYAARLPLRLLKRRDVGAWQTKTNIGVKLSSADHACILHQDDLWLPGRLQTINRWLADEPDATLHLGPTLIIDRTGRRVGRWTCPLPAEKLMESQFLLPRLLIQNFIAVPAPVFRRSSWLDCGGMDEQLWYTPDWDMWVKLCSAGPVVYHEETTTAFRVHDSSLTVTGSRDESEFRAQMQTVLERHLHRVPPGSRPTIERIARASIDVNVSLAAASRGSHRALARAAGNLLSLGPLKIHRYLRDSRLQERVIPRLRAKIAGAF